VAPIGTLRGGKFLGEILVRRGLVRDEDVAKALEAQKTQGGALGSILVQMGLITQEQLMEALGEQFGMEVVDLVGLEIPKGAVDRVEYSVASTYKVMPIRWDGTTLTVGMANPLDIATLDDLRTLLGCEVRGAVSNDKDVQTVLQKYYRKEEETIEKLMQQFGRAEGVTAGKEVSSETIDLESVEEMAESAPVRRLVNYIILTAVRERASDVHFEPYEDDYRVRQRIDGVLYEMVPPPKHLATAIASRIKVMSDLNIAERRLPQDGRIMLNIEGRPVDLRVSVLPTMFGESVVLRVLDRSVVQLDMDQIGLRADELTIVREQIAKPNGIVLVTGPTGCGKTTLYAALRELNEIGVKILTAEDPIEYDLEGVIQVQVNETIGVTFDRLLRHYLRQDPDKMLVGEIRDKETGEMAIQASLTGHIVLSTVHTLDAPSTVTRLLDLGLEPYLLTATLECVVAQRLVRRICENCKQEYVPTDELLWQLGLTREQVAGRTFFYGKGCDRCLNTGYRGRTGVFEIMVIDDPLRNLIMQRSSTNAIRRLGVERGMRTLRRAGLLHIFDGITTIEEVVRATIDEEI
jgi:type IV pilus assembly protein PilB